MSWRRRGSVLVLVSTTVVAMGRHPPASLPSAESLLPAGVESADVLPLQPALPAASDRDSAAAATDANWASALEAFRDGESPESVLARLMALWQDAPEHPRAARAQLFALDTLRADELPSGRRWSSLRLIEYALSFPHTYFAASFLTAMQGHAVRAVAELEAAGRPAAAWWLCLRLRWSMPRVDVLTPSCQHLIDHHPEVELPASAALAARPPDGAFLRLPPGRLVPELAEARDQYLRHPFDPSRLERLIRALKEAGLTEAASTLREEWLQWDPSGLWCRKVELLKSFTENDCQLDGTETADRSPRRGS